MRLEIQKSFINDFENAMNSYIDDIDGIISGFKTVKKDTYELNGGAGRLSTALNSIEARINTEIHRKTEATNILRRYDRFIDTAAMVDARVALMVEKNRNELYRNHAWLKPVEAAGDTPWYEDAWNWLKDAGEGFTMGALIALDLLDDVAEGFFSGALDCAGKLWDSATKFYDEHWYEIVNGVVTIGCAIGSMAAIAAIGAGGWAAVLVAAGVGAIAAGITTAVRSITDQQRAGGDVDWDTVMKEAGKSALIGAATGLVGGTIGFRCAPMTTNVSMGARFVIGGGIEVASGVATRGVGEAAASYMETGEIDIDRVLEESFDVQQMALDFAIGGATESVFGGGPKGDVDADTDVDGYVHQLDDGDGRLPDLNKDVPSGKLTDVDIQDSENIAYQLMGEGYVRKADFSDFHPDVARAASDSVKQAKNDFPDLDIRYIGSMENHMKEFKDSLAMDYAKTMKQTGGSRYPDDYYIAKGRELADDYVERMFAESKNSSLGWSTSFPEGSPFAQSNGIGISNKYAGDSDLLIKRKKYNVAKGFHAEGTDNIKSVFDHEIGHEIAKMLDAENDDVMQYLFRHFKRRGNPKGDLSTYGGTAIGEYIAEAYAEYRNNPNPRPDARAVFSRLETLRDQAKLSRTMKRR